MKEQDFGYRKYVLGAIAMVIVLLYVARLAVLQLASDEYAGSAKSNALFNNVLYPSRGLIYDRNGQLLVYNQPTYDIMVVTNEIEDLDTLDFCHTINITKKEFDKKMRNIRNLKGYSRYTQQVFSTQISGEEMAVLQEKLFRYRGFYIRKRSMRKYEYSYGAHLLGDIGEVNQREIDRDEYYQSGDYIGKNGVERSYEPELRGEKGVQVLLRDSRGRVQGHYQNGEFDRKPKPGKDITLTIDSELQKLGERLMEGKAGAIVAIEPSTGEILCLVSSPSFDPRRMAGKERGRYHAELYEDLNRPLLNRAIQGVYPPGSTFKISQGLTFLQEGVITTSTAYPCSRGFRFRGMKVGCHGHGAPLPLIPAIATSCNGYFCWGLFHMLNDREKYKTIQEAMTTWKDYMVSMGFGYKLGVDLPGEARGLIPNAPYYDKAYKNDWNALSVISIAIGQGEVCLTPLQIANLGATVANRGYYITPHIVKEVKGGQIADSLKQKHYTKVKKEYYDDVALGMRRSVLGGTCKKANNHWYEVCGKTGTAQNKGHDHSAFMGFAPMNDPKIAVAVYVENGGWGATYGVPYGALIMEQYINGKLSPGSEAMAKKFQARHILRSSAELKAIKERKEREAKAREEAKKARLDSLKQGKAVSTKVVKDTKAPNDVKPVNDVKPANDTKATKDTKAVTVPKDNKDPKASKVSQTTKDAKDTKDAKGAKPANAFQALPTDTLRPDSLNPQNQIIQPTSSKQP